MTKEQNSGQREKKRIIDYDPVTYWRKRSEENPLIRIFWWLTMPFIFVVIAIFPGEGSSVPTIDRFISVLIGIISTGIILAIYRFFKNEESKALSFLVWLADNRTALLQGESILFNGREINLRTTVTQFVTCISFLIPWPWGMKILSSYYVEGQPDRFRTVSLYTAISVLFGWEGVWTIIWLISTLGRNLLGGYKQTISELLSSIEETTKSENN